MNLCMNCKNFVPSPHEEFCRCAVVVNTSPVTGKKIGMYCSIERLSVAGECGWDGKLFEPREEVA